MNRRPTRQSRMRSDVFTKSSYSGGEGGGCVEVRVPTAVNVEIEDSKLSVSPRLHTSASAWMSFVRAIDGDTL